jgi:hypothetical protein
MKSDCNPSNFKSQLLLGVSRVIGFKRVKNLNSDEVLNYPSDFE